MGKKSRQKLERYVIEHPYIPPGIVDLSQFTSWQIGSLYVKVERENNWEVEQTHERIRRDCENNPLLGDDRKSDMAALATMMYSNVVLSLKSGPVVVQPPLELCRALQHIDLSIGVEDYAQPYESWAVIIPGGFFGPNEKDVLAYSVWSRDLSRLATFTDGRSLHCHQLTGVKDIEAQLAEDVEAFKSTLHTPEELIAIQRIVLNLGLLAMERGVSFDPKLQRDYRRSSPAAQQRSAVPCTIQSLDVIIRAWKESEARLESDAAGGHKRLHRRRGHWRMQAHGPRHSLRKRIYIDSFLVGVGDEENPTVVTLLDEARPLVGVEGNLQLN